MAYKIRTKVTRRGKEWEKFRKEQSRSPISIQIGVFDKELAKIATYHEFGTSTIPKRSFIRAWMTQNNSKMVDLLSEAMKDMLDGKSRDTALNKAGEFAVDGIKDRILSSIPPKLEQSTIDQKTGARRNIPLIDRGRLFDAISWRPKG